MLLHKTSDVLHVSPAKVTKGTIKEIYRRHLKIQFIDVREDVVSCVRWLRSCEVPFLVHREMYEGAYCPWQAKPVDMT
jgi:hypothetical protein